MKQYISLIVLLINHITLFSQTNNQIYKGVKELYCNVAETKGNLYFLNEISNISIDKEDIRNQFKEEYNYIKLIMNYDSMKLILMNSNQLQRYIPKKYFVTKESYSSIIDPKHTFSLSKEEVKGKNDPGNKYQEDREHPSALHLISA